MKSLVCFATFLSGACFGQGTVLPSGAWTQLASPGGYTATAVGYDGTAWISSRQCLALWGEALPGSFSENNDALFCYSYAEHRWHLLSISGGFHSTHRPPMGHDNQAISYDSDSDSLWLVVDGSYGNIPENYGGLWQLDMAGLVGIDHPLLSSSGVLTRQWLPGASTPINASVYDSTHHRLVYFTDFNLADGTASICNLSAATCSLSSTANGPPLTSVGASVSGTFNSADGKTYWFMDSTTPFYSLDANTGTWASLSPTCSGVDCTGGHPPVRTGAGMAYSSVDNVIFIMSGYNGSTNYFDTWKWDTAANTVTELCSACGYANSSATGGPKNRLIFDATDNAFIYVSGDSSLLVWGYTLGTALNYGRTAASYAPPLGSLNKTPPPTSPGSGTTEGFSADPSISIGSGSVYISHVESAPSSEANSNCLPLVAYIYNASTSSYLPTGSLGTGCTAIGNGSNIWPSSHVYVANVGGTVWEAHSMTNQAGGSADTRSFARSYNSGTSLWSGGGAVGCFTAACGANITSTPAGLIAIGTTPTIAVIEQDKSLFVRENYLYVAQWNGSSWGLVGGRLNINAVSSGTFVTSASIATDGSNPAACWAERVDTGRSTMGTTPQIQCSRWTGSAWSRLGTTSLNQTSSDFAYSPSLAYLDSRWYAAFTEQSQTGNLLVYVKVYDANSNSWTLVGSGTLNQNASTGMAFHASLATDGSQLFVAWEEQSAPGQHALGYCMRLDGTTTAPFWSKIGGAIAADTTNGSVSDIGIVVLNGRPTAAWTEQVWGSLTQLYSAQWNGLAWSQTYGSNTTTLSVPITVQEALIPGTNGFSGLARTNEPMTAGIPISDAAAVTSISQLGLSSTSIGQFAVESAWPDGNVQWLKIRSIIPSVTAGGSTSITLNNSGSGAFGGSNLATDNGSTITVNTNGGTCGAGSAICFTIKKSNFNFIDSATIGATTLISTGASAGIVVIGPAGTGTYPANATCSPTSGGATCATLFTSANDGANSTCAIEENGPAVAVVKCSSDLNDGSAHVYMHQTTRLYFYQNRAQVKYTTILRNADYGTSSTFATASKGFQGFEIRITPNISGTLTYQIANDATTTSGTMSGTDSTYLYQAESDLGKASGWCAGTCGPPSTISGFSIMHNGSALVSGSSSQYPIGWADIATSGGVGVMIGQDQLAAYGNKSLEFQGGGSDVRIGLWASENNTIGTSSTTPVAPYYQAWPQWSIHNGWLEFHTTALASAANDHLMLEYPLLAHADLTWYNATGVFPDPLEDPTEESNYYTTVLSAATPAVPPVTALDSVMGDTSNAGVTCSGRGNGSIPTVCVYRYWPWASPGGANQMEFRLSGLYNFIRRGFTGQYMNSVYWYKWAAEDAFPMSDGFKWTSHASETQYYGFPTATSANYALSIAGAGGQSRLNIEADMEHGNAQGYDTFYLMSGDETIKDSYLESVVPFFVNSTSVNNYTTISPAIWNDRAVGNVFKWFSHLYPFLNSVGDPGDADSILNNAKTVYTVRIQPSLCAYPGYPTGCTPDITDSIPQVGQSLTRGMTNIYRDTSLTTVGCSGGITMSPRTEKPFMASRKLEGMLEFYNVLKRLITPWTYTQQFQDYMYGGAQWAFGEMMLDNGLTAWTGNGFRYGMAIDYANACNTDDWSNVNNETIWYHWTTMEKYLGPLSAAKIRELNYVIQANSGNGNIDEFYHNTMATAIYYELHPSAGSLQTIPITSFTDNGGGSYTIGWTTPVGTTSLRGKWGAKQIVDWIGFDAGMYSWIGNPATTQNWFASTEISNLPSPVAGNQTATVATGTMGLNSTDFSIRAFSPTIPSSVGSSVSGPIRISGPVSIH